MKKVALYILAILVIFCISYGVGYYVGYYGAGVAKTSEPQQLQETMTATSPTHENTKTLKESLKTEQAKTQQLQQELEQQKQKVAQLEQMATTSPAPPKEEVIPATAYERTAFVTNLIHQFNADNASTEIVDLDCTNTFCFLTANVSAGANTNPEIANLLKFLDDKRLPSHYQEVELLNVTKEEEHSSIKLALNME